MNRREFLKIGAGLLATQYVGSLSGISWAAEKALTVGQSKAITMAQNNICAFKKFDADFGIKIEPTMFSSGLSANEALVSGNLDAAFCGDTASLGSFAVGAPIKTVMVGNYGGDAQAVLAGPGTGITKIADLKGKKIGGTVGTAPHRLISILLEKEGIADQVQLFNMKIEDVATALATKRIDAAFGWEPWPTFWEKRVEAKVIVRGGNIIAAAMYLNVPEKLIREQRETVYRMVLAFAKTEQYIRTGNRKEIVDYVAKTFKMDEDEVAMGFKVVQFDPRISPFVIQDIKGGAAFMYKIKKLERIPDVEKFFYGEFLDRAMKEHPELFKDLK